MEKVPQAGYEIKGLWISGIQRNLKISNLAFPLKLFSSILESHRILRAFQPDVAIGTGGYASAPLLKSATMRRIPCLIQEQNSYAGITNKWLSKSVQTICVAYPNMDRFFPKDKLVFTGNPVRQDLIDGLLNQEEAYNHFNLDPQKRTLLVLGGSLGARKINELIQNHLKSIESEGVQLLWQCGSYYYEEYKGQESKNVRVKAFIQRMDLAYAAADVIVSRAGALSVSELCLAGKPVIFIPSPNVAEDHQTKNAEAIAKEGAALLLKENEVDVRFMDAFKKLHHDISKMEALGIAIKKLAKPNATQAIADEVEKLIPKHK